MAPYAEKLITCTVIDDRIAAELPDDWIRFQTRLDTIVCAPRSECGDTAESCDIGVAVRLHKRPPGDVFDWLGETVGRRARPGVPTVSIVMGHAWSVLGFEYTDGFFSIESRFKVLHGCETVVELSYLASPRWLIRHQQTHIGSGRYVDSIVDVIVRAPK